MASVSECARLAVRASMRASRTEVSKAMLSTASVVISTRLSRPLPFRPSTAAPQKLPSAKRAAAIPV
ncbi:hypothetical protein D3C76_1800940 [compost metagenome]